MAKSKAPIKFVLLVARREKIEEASEILGTFGAMKVWTMLGQGVDRSGVLSVLGLAEAECAVILSVVQIEKVKPAISMLCDKLELAKQNNGMVFSIPINAISQNTLSGLVEISKQLSANAKESEKTQEKSDNLDKAEEKAEVDNSQSKENLEKEKQ